MNRLHWRKWLGLLVVIAALPLAGDPAKKAATVSENVVFNVNSEFETLTNLAKGELPDAGCDCTATVTDTLDARAVPVAVVFHQTTGFVISPRGEIRPVLLLIGRGEPAQSTAEPVKMIYTDLLFRPPTVTGKVEMRPVPLAQQGKGVFRGGPLLPPTATGKFLTRPLPLATAGYLPPAHKFAFTSEPRADLGGSSTLP